MLNANLFPTCEIRDPPVALVSEARHEPLGVIEVRCPYWQDLLIVSVVRDQEPVIHTLDRRKLLGGGTFLVGVEPIQLPALVLKAFAVRFGQFRLATEQPLDRGCFGQTKSSIE